MKQFHWAFGSPYFNKENLPFGFVVAINKLQIDFTHCNKYPARMENYFKRGERLHQKLMKYYLSIYA